MKAAVHGLPDFSNIAAAQGKALISLNALKRTNPILISPLPLSGSTVEAMERLLRAGDRSKLGLKGG